MKKIITITILIITIIFIILYFNYDLEIESIKQLNFNTETNELTLEIVKKNNIFNKKYKCILYNETNNISIDGNNKCIITFKVGENYNLILKDNLKESKIYNITDYIENNLEFKFKYETMYMSLNETKKIEYQYKNIDNKNINFYIKDDILNINNDEITAKKVGETKIYKDENTYMNVVVTDLINLPSIQNKQYVPCNRYTNEENILIDKILKYDVEEAGYQTRAGVVAAARFLTLKFPYKIPYFYENGRISGTGVNFVDGEGRYYHKGLYLSDVKKQELIAIISGPSSWGCPLTNWEDDPDYGFEWGKKMPNGLDCSGFVTWALYNGGFDPGDRGAGESEYPNQVTDLGKFTKLTNNLIDSNAIKAGDIFNYWGHVALIIGIDDENYYVAESLQNFYGLVVRTYKKTNVNKTFKYVVLMDEYYKNDGNYTKYW